MYATTIFIPALERSVFATTIRIYALEHSVFATVFAGSSSAEVEDGTGGRASVAYSVQASSGAGRKSSRPGRKSGKRSEKSCPFRILCEYRRKSGTSPPVATAQPGSSANIDENPENAFESAAFSGFSSSEPDAPALPTRPRTVTRNGKDWEGTTAKPRSHLGTELPRMEPRPERRIQNRMGKEPGNAESSTVLSTVLSCPHGVYATSDRLHRERRVARTLPGPASLGGM